MGASNSFVRLDLALGIADPGHVTDSSIIGAVSGGFAIVQPGSQLSINAVEGFPLEDFSADVSSV